MIEFISLLNQNAGFISLIFSFFVTISTVVYAILTYKLVNETIKMRKVQTEPLVSIIIEQREFQRLTFDLKIINIGQGPAFNINLSINPDFQIFPYDSNISQTPFFKNGIKHLVPNQMESMLLTHTSRIKFEEFAFDFIIIVKYENIRREIKEDRYIFNLNDKFGLIYNDNHPMKEVAKTLAKIGDNTYKVAQYFNYQYSNLLTNDELSKNNNKRNIGLKLRPCIRKKYFRKFN